MRPRAVPSPQTAQTSESDFGDAPKRSSPQAGKGTKPSTNPSTARITKQIIERLNQAFRDRPHSITDAGRSVRRELSRMLKDANAPRVREVAKHLLRVPKVPRFIVYELLMHHPAALASLSYRELNILGRNLNTWGDVDAFACYVVGPVWRQGQISDKQVLGWANSANPWWRRTALVSTVPLNNRARGGSGDVRKTLRICRALVRDREDTVIKALSWALRELAKREPEAVGQFLNKYDNVVAARVRREVRNKLATGLKNPRR